VPVPSGQDPAGECGAVSCVGSYYGWVGDSCYRKADVSAAQAACNGAGACRTAAAECTAQTARGPATITCNSACQDPLTATCTGTTAGTCTNVNPGNQMCGQGVCAVTVPQCTNGAPNTCAPNSGAATTETCNGLDDNCDGTPDNNDAFADGQESNDSCGSYRTLTAVSSDQTITHNNLTLYPAGDVDFYRIVANETDSSCGCGAFSTDEDYRLTVTLTVPAGAGSYDFCIDAACGSVGNNCRLVNAGTSSSWMYNLDGSCPGTDSYSVYIRISGGASPGMSCQPYTLSYFFDAGLCL
jgi:hypothetical protein